MRPVLLVVALLLSGCEAVGWGVTAWQTVPSLGLSETAIPSPTRCEVDASAGRPAGLDCPRPK